MLSRPAAVSLASRRLRKWGREGGTRRGRSERPCSAYARSSSMRRRTLRCASAASRRTGSGTSAVDPRNPRERRTRWLRIGGSIEIRSRTPAWIAARAAPVRGRRSGSVRGPRARRKDHDGLAPAREASRCRDRAARFVAPRSPGTRRALARAARAAVARRAGPSPCCGTRADRARTRARGCRIPTGDSRRGRSPRRRGARGRAPAAGRRAWSAACPPRLARGRARGPRVRAVPR
jgi:hypothetical protein